MYGRYMPPSHSPEEETVTDEMDLVSEEIVCTGSIYMPPQVRRGSLGGAILLAAIGDYRSMNDEVHKDADQFLYPRTPEHQQHYDWAVSVAGGLNPTWLRDALDRSRRKWDVQRLERRTSDGRRRSPAPTRQGGRSRCKEGQR
jgi:hypothetical protein